ncbi:Protein of unknown function [Cotesia congregata]|uniref:Uncharacterized protein n=1 Tax=Cotesia congregata TaxID=51543 RepID=A0A8J2MTG2_COTCN|nr:Protein of unknown function [Cotesia congregata]
MSDYYCESLSSGSGNNYYQLHGGYYSPQSSSGPRFPGVQRYGSLAEEVWSTSAKDELPSK